MTIVGAGAAGLMCAIAAARANARATVRLVDGAARPGAKILVSGGGRCNVTNRTVTERDFWGGRPGSIRRILRAFSARDAARFFEDQGVPLHEEAGGKLFPDSGRARDVLDALLRAAGEARVDLRGACRVQALERDADGFRLVTTAGVLQSALVVLATGGQSLPKSGSDGTGLELARLLGHTVVPTTPALVPLTLDPVDPHAIHVPLSGVAQDTEVAVWVDGRVARRLRGALLWTHTGISGPAALDASRHYLRAVLDGRDARLTVSFAPGERLEQVEQWWMAAALARPKASVVTLLATRVPSAVAAALVARLRIDPTRPLAHLSKEDRRALAGALVAWPLPVTGSRGWTQAEVTAGGVALDEVDPATMASRICPGLYLVGEVLDVDGRLGGFNFQWAWSTGVVAGRAVAARLSGN